ncbi:hypothetical protein IWQ62_001083 [Dispira parvispora]|uniref:Uncharacterized protein n=1 Tax=Dispira parvispora TaxID=1520584 RepID=A0A9W8E9H0_9FUNG|nr:hypothetical protein IWQ62_001083 [Dispira parvispora]
MPPEPIREDLVSTFHNALRNSQSLTQSLVFRTLIAKGNGTTQQNNQPTPQPEATAKFVEPTQLPVSTLSQDSPPVNTPWQAALTQQLREDKLTRARQPRPPTRAQSFTTIQDIIADRLPLHDDLEDSMAAFDSLETGQNTFLALHGPWPTPSALWNWYHPEDVGGVTLTRLLGQYVTELPEDAIPQLVHRLATQGEYSTLLNSFGVTSHGHWTVQWELINDILERLDKPRQKVFYSSLVQTRLNQGEYTGDLTHPSSQGDAFPYELRTALNQLQTLDTGDYDEVSTLLVQKFRKLTFGYPVETWLQTVKETLSKPSITPVALRLMQQLGIAPLAMTPISDVRATSFWLHVLYQAAKSLSMEVIAPMDFNSLARLVQLTVTSVMPNTTKGTVTGDSDHHTPLLSLHEFIGFVVVPGLTLATYRTHHAFYLYSLATLAALADYIRYEFLPQSITDTWEALVHATSAGQRSVYLVSAFMAHDIETILLNTLEILLWAPQCDGRRFIRHNHYLRPVTTLLIYLSLQKSISVYPNRSTVSETLAKLHNTLNRQDYRRVVYLYDSIHIIQEANPEWKLSWSIPLPSRLFELLDISRAKCFIEWTGPNEAADTLMDDGEDTWTNSSSAVTYPDAVVESNRPDRPAELLLAMIEICQLSAQAASAMWHPMHRYLEAHGSIILQWLPTALVLHCAKLSETEGIQILQAIREPGGLLAYLPTVNGYDHQSPAAIHSLRFCALLLDTLRCGLSPSLHLTVETSEWYRPLLQSLQDSMNNTVKDMVHWGDEENPQPVTCMRYFCHLLSDLIGYWKGYQLSVDIASTEQSMSNEGMTALRFNEEQMELLIFRVTEQLEHHLQLPTTKSFLKSSNWPGDLQEMMENVRSELKDYKASSSLCAKLDALLG